KVGVSSGGVRRKPASAVSRSPPAPRAASASRAAHWSADSSSSSPPTEPRVTLCVRCRPLCPPYRAERHAADALDEPEPEHRGQGPELADPERDHLLERRDETGQIVELDPGFGVGDERDGDLVDPGIPRERSGGEFGQLAVVLPREALANLEDVLLHHVQVVEQPFPGGPDVVVL